MEKQITFVSVSDWVAMYIDGVKVAEGHSLHYTHVLDALGIRYSTENASEVDDGETVFTDRLEDIHVFMYPKED